MGRYETIHDAPDPQTLIIEVERKSTEGAS